MFPRASVKHQLGLICQSSGGTRQGPWREAECRLALGSWVGRASDDARQLPDFYQVSAHLVWLLDEGGRPRWGGRMTTRGMNRSSTMARTRSGGIGW
jgi:hypothetical protein